MVLDALRGQRRPGNAERGLGGLHILVLRRWTRPKCERTRKGAEAMRPPCALRSGCGVCVC
eukprot:6611771-Prymnesium_polylepis.1